MDNNLKELVRLLDSLKKAYLREVENNNIEKANEIKVQIPRIIAEIKKIKEDGKLEGETMNINSLQNEFENNNIEGNDLNKEEEYYEDDEYYDSDEYEDDEYEEEKPSKGKEKSLKAIKKELDKEKKRLKKIAAKKKKVEKKKVKLLRNEEKYTKSHIKKKERFEKRKARTAYWIERKNRKNSQLKEPKTGTMLIFILVLSLVLLAVGRAYVYQSALDLQILHKTIRYIDMYNFFARLYIVIVTICVFIYSMYQHDLKNQKTIKILTIVTGILLYISFDGIPFVNFKFLIGNVYLFVPGICAIILLELIGRNILRDKIHYDYDYN